MKKGTIKSKLIVGISIPITVIFLVIGVLLLSLIGRSYTKMLKQELELKSQSSAYQVSGFFNQYNEIVKQMQANELLKQMMREIKEPGSAQDVDAYAAAEQCLDNILATESNIPLAWTVDLDSGESVRSGGVIRGLTTDYDVTTRSWYVQAMQEQKLIVTEPYLDTLSQTMVTSIIAPIYENNSSQMLGLVAIDLTLETLNELMSSYSLGKSSFFILMTDSGTIMHHPNEEMVTLNIEESGLSQNILTAISNGTYGSYDYELDGVSMKGYLTSVGDTGWKVLAGITTQEFNQEFLSILFSTSVVILISILVIILLLMKIANAIAIPVMELGEAANRIADGDLDVHISCKTNDEINQVSIALQRTVERLKEYIAYIDELSDALNEIANGNLKLELKQNYNGEFSKLKDSLEHFVLEFSSIMNEINVVSSQVASGSVRVASGAQTLADGTLTQVQNIEDLSKALNAMTQSLHHSADDAKVAVTKAEEEQRYVVQSKQKLQELKDAIYQINSKSDAIGKIVQTIDNIAFQTSILSLNASIEAARAGEVGKGFAVVAGEVNDLAQKSTNASKNIAQLITETLQAVEVSVAIATESENMQDLVVKSAAESNETMLKISENSKRQILQCQEIQTEVERVSSVINSNSTTADESHEASDSLSGQAKLLRNLVKKFHTK